MTMIIPTTFIETFGLTPDPLYTALERVAAHFTNQQYTTAQIMGILEKKYKQRGMRLAVWIPKVNKTIDALVHHEFLTYKEGYFYGKLRMD